MKRVALVYTFGNLKKEVTFLGGAERRINYIFSNIKNDGLEVEQVFVLDKNRESVLRLLDVYLNKSAKITIVESYYKLFRYLVKNKFDMVCYVDCIIQTVPAIVGAMVAKSERMMIIESSNRAYGVYKRGAKERIMMNWNCKRSNYLDTLYPSSKKLLEKKYGKHCKITVTPCTLPRIERYTKRVEKEKVILFAGRLNENKNPELFIKAAVECAEEMRNKGFCCWVCGDGPLREQMRAIVDESGCSDVIDMKGYVNMEDTTPYCKVFCSLQHTENYPSQSLLEAITSGCYCICTNPGDTGVIIREDFGILIEENIASLSEAFRRVLCFDEDDWNEIETAARSFAKEHFDVAKAVKHYENLFLEGHE